MEKQQVAAIDGRKCEQKWIDTGRNPEHLARFLRAYPAAFHLSWVKNEIARWGASGHFDNFKLIQPTAGNRRVDTGLRQVYTDFLIFQAVTELLKQMPLTGNNGALMSIAKKPPKGMGYYSPEKIRDKYYRFVKHEPVYFIDDLQVMIYGPGRVSIPANDGSWIEIIDIVRYERNSGFELITK